MGTVAIRPVYVPLEVVRGTDNAFRVAITNAAGVAQPITGDTISFVARARKGGPSRITKTLTISNGPAGLADLEIADTDLVNLDGLRADADAGWVYAITRVQASGERNVYFEGPFVILASADS